MLREFIVSCILLTIMVNGIDGVIFRVNDTQYERLPQISLLDDYEKCMYDLEPLYCTTELELVSDEPSELLDFIRNYSARELTHYNYSQLYRGVCVTRTCKISKEATLMDRHSVLEGCLNKTIWRKYKLKTRLISSPMCYPTDENKEKDKWDIIFAVTCAFIIALNIAATFYDQFSSNKTRSKGIDLFLAFSITRNWNTLRKNDTNTKSNAVRLKSIDGLRAAMMIYLMMGHTMFSFVVSVSNTRFIEEVYYSLPYHVLINAMYIVEYYFVMSGCLLSYNIERLAEKKNLNLITIPSNIFKRWLRLTPSFAIVLAFTSTWSRFMGSGPLWQANVIKEINDCRHHWVWNLMYISNYVDGSQCLPQTWYIAADMQLHCLGVILLVLTVGSRWRKRLLSVALLIGIITPAIPTYIHNLETLLTLSPQSLRNYAVSEPTFDYLYKRTHTNIANYVIGIILGICIHRWQNSEIDIKKYKKYLPLYWSTIPLGSAIIVSCKVFYNDGPEVPLYLRVLFQMFARPVLAVLFSVLVVGMVFKYESFYRNIFEWSGWSWLSRICYSAYILHLTIYRLIFGNRITLTTISPLSAIPVVGLVVLSIFVATLFWLILEEPMNQVVKVMFEFPTKSVSSKTKANNKKE